MRALLLALAAGTLALPASSQADAAAPRELVVRAGTMHVGDGSVLEGARLRVRDGKIIEITKDEGDLPVGVPVLDLRKQTVIPGLVAAHTDLAAVDQESNLTPDTVAADQFDYFRKWTPLLATGITSAYLSPGRRRLMPGQGSVVKLGGDDPMARLLRGSAALNIQLTPASRQNIPAVFEPPEIPTSDDPLLPARRQRGATRHSQLAVLTAAFDEARDANRELGGEGNESNQYSLDTLRRVMSGALPVRLAAETAADAWHGLALLRTLGAKVILEQPVQAEPLVDELVRSGVGCIVALPLRPAEPNPGDFVPGDERQPRPRPETAGILSRAGVRVAITPATDQDLDKLRVIAGLACRYGMPASKALAAITLDAARILGVDDRVGSLAVGKDADFVVLSGAPFDARSQVERVVVDGITVYEPSDITTTFAIRAGRVLVGDGREYRDAIVVVRGGKILDAGPSVPVPAGAEVIDAPEMVLAPGFIAAASKLGLHSDGNTPIVATTDVDVAAALQPEDPAFRDALAAGVTTLFVTPDSGGGVGSRIAAIKTHGESKGFVVREVTGIRLMVGAGGNAGKAQLLGLIKKAKDYIEPPAKKEAEKKPEAKEGEAKPADRISGKWTGELTGGPLPRPIGFTCELKLDGTKVEATLQLQMMPVPVKLTGTFENDQLKLSGEAPGMGPLQCTGKLEGDRIVGTITTSQGDLAFSMSRAGEAPAASSSTAAKDAPKKDDTLEPWRGIFKKEACLVARVANAEAAQAAIDAIAVESSLRLVLEGNARDVVRKHVRTPKDTDVGFILGANEVLFEEKGERQNVAQALADLGYRVILVGRAQIGTRYLPVHAAWAVATGFDARKALAGISGAPAQCFGIADRIGLVAEGGDADLVLLSGDPFDLTTRVLAVWVDGVLRVDHRQERP